MLRLLALPFAVLLGVVSVVLIAGGVSLLEEQGGEPDRRSGALLDVGAFNAEEEDSSDDSGAIAGASLVGFGVLGLIAAVALLIASLSRDPEPVVVQGSAAGAQQQQQQQVVVVTHPDGRVEVHDRR